ncbi:MAG TPA: SOS response-associated peptidase family protein [Chitinophagaceae bacterium]|nr:SOS response-associated peptidase family protein [Chitinophagaceae bacterium]
MCYDIAFATSIRSITDYFPELILDPQLNLEFTQDHVQGSGVFGEHPILYINKEGKMHLHPMAWSAVEYWQKEPLDMKDFKVIKKRNGYLNARSERILDDPKSYWYKIRNRRCLIPVTGIYEHRGILKWKTKLPYHVRPKDQPLFFLPGLYSVYKTTDTETGEVIDNYTFTLITRPGNEVMCKIHNSGDNPFRMPLFLPLELSKEFISPGLSEDRYRAILNYEMPSDALDYWPVFTIRTGKPHPAGLRKFERWDWPNTPIPELGTMNPPLEKEAG